MRQIVSLYRLCLSFLLSGFCFHRNEFFWKILKRFFISLFIFLNVSLAAEESGKRNCRFQFTSFPVFQTARIIAQNAGVTTQKEYQAKYKELGLPSQPDKTYREDWQSLGHFLGTGRKRGGLKKNFPSFAEAMELAQKAEVTTMREYRTKYKELGLPSQPAKIYQADWQGWGHFLGTGRTKRKVFPSFAEAMELVQTAGVTTSIEYQVKYKELGLPSQPDKFYKEDWQGWGYFLGTGRTKSKIFPSFAKAMELVQTAKVTARREYRVKYKKLGLPSHPDRAYKADWQGWGHFLGTKQTKGRPKKNFPSFVEAIELVQKAKVTTSMEYRFKYRELGLPSTPSVIYKEEWQSWGHFLGIRR